MKSKNDSLKIHQEYSVINEKVFFITEIGVIIIKDI